VALQFLAILAGQPCVKGKVVLENTAPMGRERICPKLLPLLLVPHAANHVAPESWHCRARLAELTLVPKGASCSSMELDLEGQFAERAYPILASLVVPRPIALVTTISPDGKVNAAPFSFFNVMGAAPPILAVAPGDRDDGTPKDTARNIRLTHEFVVNLVDESHL